MSFGRITPTTVPDMEKYVTSLTEAAEEVARWLKSRKEGEEPPPKVIQAANMVIVRTEQWRRM